jgi:Pretoxin HINT domain/Domain of unknown function (DUF4280)/HNH/ENDO VII superfamily nuclease with conserved GHE residues
MEELEYITKKALLQCTNGAAPGIFTPTYNTHIKINGCVVATEVDKASMANVPSFVVCKKTQKPCVPITTAWQNTYPVKVKGKQTLIGKSCMTCGIGGKIEFMLSGQVPLGPDEEKQIEGMRDDVKKAHEEEMEEKNKSWWQKAGEFIVDCVPVVGPIVSLVKNVSKGNWGMAALDVGFLALDVVGLVAAPFTGGASVAGATAAKIGVRQAIKAGVKQVAKKVGKEALEAAAKQTAEVLSKMSVKRLTMGRLCVFACFPAGTPVATKNGLKNIEDIRAGEEVWAYDEKTGEIGLKRVLSTNEQEVHTLVELTIEGEVIRTTPDHPFYVNNEWREAGLLETGDGIMLFSGRLARIEKVDYIYNLSKEPVADVADFLTEEDETITAKVYNFEVEGWHSYFVGWLRFLVHNGKGICLKQVVKEIKAGIKKKREILLGRTPGKSSSTGKAVKERMKKEKTFRVKRGKEQFRSKKDGKWYSIDKADMSHKTDAVTWWNRNSGKYQARSPEVRKWMRDPDNYYLEHYKYNRSDGARIGKTYKLPKK